MDRACSERRPQLTSEKGMVGNTATASDCAQFGLLSQNLSPCARQTRRVRLEGRGESLFGAHRTSLEQIATTSSNPKIDDADCKG
jgi:hypothetical protein